MREFLIRLLDALHGLSHRDAPRVRQANVKS
jgi:hypothetical protein